MVLSEKGFSLPNLRCEYLHSETFLLDRKFHVPVNTYKICINIFPRCLFSNLLTENKIQTIANERPICIKMHVMRTDLKLQMFFREKLMSPHKPNLTLESPPVY